MLKDDPEIIRKYEQFHAAPWPIVLRKGYEAGIRRVFIYRFGRQLFMFLEAIDGFDIETSMAKALTDPEMIRWDKLMHDMQEAVPGAEKNTTWVQMKEIHAVENGKLAHWRFFLRRYNVVKAQQKLLENFVKRTKEI